MVMLGAYIGATDIVSFDSLMNMLDKKMGHKKDLLEMNHKAISEGRRIGEEFRAKAGSK
jgi:2-oxoglutarate ferredoxin oxidoreductase subunit gamma